MAEEDRMLRVAEELTLIGEVDSPDRGEEAQERRLPHLARSEEENALPTFLEPGKEQPVLHVGKIRPI